MPPSRNYEDPEDLEFASEWSLQELEPSWESPAPPDEADCVDNLHWHRFAGRDFYTWTGPSPGGFLPLGVALTYEIHAPWRRGVGVLLRGREKARAYGFGWKGRPPVDLHAEPDALSLDFVVRRSSKR